MLFKLRPLVNALVLLGVSQSVYAAIEISPNQLTVGKAVEVKIKNDGIHQIQKMSLQPGGPALIKQLSHDFSEQTDFRLASKQDHTVVQQRFGAMWVDAVRFPNHSSAITANNIKIENHFEIALYKKSQVLSRYTTSYPIHDVVVINDIAVLANDCNGVTIVDVQDGAQPTWLGSHQKLGRIVRVIKADDKVLAVNDANVIFLISIKDPTEPTVVNAYRSRSKISDIAYFDQTVFTNSAENIQITLWYF